MQRFFLYMSYNGKNYHGWQSQNNANSIQQETERCLSLLLRTDVKLTGAGRTDTGVHATFFTAHFDIKELLKKDQKKLLHKLNNFLPEDIAVFDIRQVVPEAHSRFDAVSRTYQYYISGTKNPFKNDYRLKLPQNTYEKLSLDLMNEACKILFSYDDFSSFCKSGTQTKTKLCRILQADVCQSEDEMMITIKADRFLRNMVRAISGTLIDVGLQKITLKEFHEIIKSKTRTRAGTSVPAKGLFLCHIAYKKDIFI